MSYQFIDVRREGEVEYVALDRPDVRNAFNEVVVEELTRWAKDVARAPVRVVVLSGRGSVFCAGADLEWMTRARTYGREEYGRDARQLSAMLQALDTLPQALVGRVHGAAIAGGVGLVAVCDVAITADDTVFAFPEVKLGIVPAIISPYVIAKIGRSAARALFVTGARFGAARAGAIGLVHEVVPATELDDAVSRCVTELLSSAPGAVSTAKTLVREVAGRPAATAGPLTVDVLTERRLSDEGSSGLASFLEKKSPPWARST